MRGGHGTGNWRLHVGGLAGGSEMRPRTQPQKHPGRTQLPCPWAGARRRVAIRPSGTLSGYRAPWASEYRTCSVEVAGSSEEWIGYPQRRPAWRPARCSVFQAAFDPSK